VIVLDPPSNLVLSLGIVGSDGPISGSFPFPSIVVWVVPGMEEGGLVYPLDGGCFGNWGLAARSNGIGIAVLALIPALPGLVHMGGPTAHA